MAFIFYLTHIHIGSDALLQLKPECGRIGIRRPLIVSDKGVVATGLVDRVTATLGTIPYVIFDDTPSNPTEVMARLGLPPGDEQVGVKRGMVDTVIRRGLVDDCHKTNPYEASAEEYRQPLEASF